MSDQGRGNDEDSLGPAIVKGGPTLRPSAPTPEPAQDTPLPPSPTVLVAPDPAGLVRPVPNRDASLADQKLELEVDKLIQDRLETQLTATTNTAVGISKSQLELNKLYHEALKAKADSVVAGKTPGIEWFKAIGGLVTALAGVATVYVALQTANGAIQKQNAEDEHRFHTDAASLVDSLGDPSEVKRSAAAIALRPYVSDSRTQTLTLGALAYALGVETSPDVQQSIASSLVAAGEPSLELLKSVISRENALAAVEFSRVGKACKDLSTDQAMALTRLRARQTAVILAAQAISLVGKTKIDLSGGKLKCYEFDGLPVQFEGASFSDAVLVGSILYRKNLKKADFSDAQVMRAQLNYADMSEVRLTRNTDFSEADMQCVTLKNVKGVSPVELVGLLRSATSLENARLDPEVAGALKDKINPPGAKPCEY